MSFVNEILKTREFVLFTSLSLSLSFSVSLIRLFNALCVFILDHLKRKWDGFSQATHLYVAITLRMTKRKIKLLRSDFSRWVIKNVKKNIKNIFLLNFFLITCVKLILKFIFKVFLNFIYLIKNKCLFTQYKAHSTMMTIANRQEKNVVGKKNSFKQ